MASTESPYRSPGESSNTTSQKNLDPTSRTAVNVPVAFPLFGGLIGFVGYLAAALVIESQNQPLGPNHSYGQQAALISLPICTMTGVGIGFGLALAVARRHFVSICVLMAVGLLGSGIVASMWNDQIARYGRDPSEVVLYYPPVAACVIASVLAVMVGCIAGVPRLNRVSCYRRSSD